MYGHDYVACSVAVSRALTLRPDVSPLDKHAVKAGVGSLLFVVLELGGCWADVVHHILQAQLMTAAATAAAAAAAAAAAEQRVKPSA
jgi:hypothetical protein